jgi:hypothetical protein
MMASAASLLQARKQKLALASLMELAKKNKRKTAKAAKWRRKWREAESYRGDVSRKQTSAEKKISMAYHRKLENACQAEMKDS